MRNFWLVRADRRKAVRHINAMLRTFVGQPLSDATLYDRMKRAVLNYLKNTPEAARLLSSGNRIDFKFHIDHGGGLVKAVSFVPDDSFLP